MIPDPVEVRLCRKNRAEFEGSGSGADHAATRCDVGADCVSGREQPFNPLDRS